MESSRAIRYLLIIILLFYCSAKLQAAPVLYKGSLEVKAISGGACPGKEAGKAVELELVLDQGATGVTGYFSGTDIATGQFSGKDAGSLAVVYPFAEQELAEGHRLKLSLNGDSASGTLQERHLAATVDNCNYDLAELKLAISGDDAAGAWKKADARFNAQLARSQGLSFYRQEKHVEAIPLFEKALGLREAVEGKGAEMVAYYLLPLAKATYRSGDHDKAISLLEGRLPDFSASGQRVEIVSTLAGFIHDKQARYVAYNKYRKALTSMNAAMAGISLENNDAAVETLAKLAEFNSAMGNYDTAEQYYEQGERILSQGSTKDRKTYAEYLARRAAHYERYRKFDDAERLYQQALTVSSDDRKSEYAEALVELYVNRGDTASAALRCRDYISLIKNKYDVETWLQGYCSSTGGDSKDKGKSGEGRNGKYSQEYQCNKSKEEYSLDLSEYGEIDAVSRRIAHCYLEAGKLPEHPLTDSYPELFVLADDKSFPENYIELFTNRKDKIELLENIFDLSISVSEERRGNIEEALGNINRIVKHAIYIKYIGKYITTRNLLLLDSMALNSTLDLNQDDGDMIDIVSLFAGITRASGNIDRADKLVRDAYSRLMNLNEKQQLMLAFNLFVTSLERHDYRTAISVMQNHDLYRLKNYLNAEDLITYGWALDGYQYADIFRVVYKNDKITPYMKDLFANPASRYRIIEDLCAKVEPKLIFERCSGNAGATGSGQIALEFEKNRFKVCRNGVAILANTTNEDIVAATVNDAGYKVSTRLADYIYTTHGILLRKNYKATLGIKYDSRNYVVKEFLFGDVENTSELKVGDRLKRIGDLEITSTTTQRNFSGYVSQIPPGQVIPMLVERNGETLRIKFTVSSAQRLANVPALRVNPQALVTGDVVYSGNVLTLYDTENLDSANVKLDELSTITRIFVAKSKIAATDEKSVCSLDVSAPERRTCHLLLDNEVPLAIAGTSEFVVYDRARMVLKYYDLLDFKSFCEQEVKQFGISKTPLSVITVIGTRILYKHNEQHRYYFVDKATGGKWRIRGRIVAVYDDETISTYDNEHFTYTKAGASLPVTLDNVVKAGISEKHLFFVTSSGELFLYEKNGKQIYHGYDYGHLQSVQSKNDRIYLYLSGNVVRVLHSASAAAATGGNPVLAYSIKFFDGGGWAVATPEGRFDTNDIEGIKDLHWVLPDDPLTPLPLEVFMKEYYEPRLLPRILNGDTFKPVKNLMTLNRVLPTVAITSVTREGEGDTVSVTVAVYGQKRKIGERERETGAADLKLFRAGQLVGFQEGRIDLDRDGKGTVTFTDIRLPRTAGIKEVEFSAYAFNDDGVKSLTNRSAFAMPVDITPVRGKAYLVTIGVNRYQNSAWNLQYAASDAQKIRQSLENRVPGANPYADIVPITLADEQATKGNIQAVFDLLAGKQVSQQVSMGT
ncbi:tetratricopeptide repeat protein [Geobacter hydrogenophilus]|uniref:Tetratricopeptide repeat protein n=1 Tax=Geobacter hydrogenophilus TaxID=40983 RepID=A0A9W6LBV6_9BACT|nr:tetratricopeptide repeat protein [Geobacter hydrogenophilus]MBT0895047.1 tetratricopeptide repeat protein [Geobacter hydrogenophilus]GLI36871.1 hypothetical protein GHYDROH2_03720 [Geobacter hydrogenophilus]